jgi:nucleotide-binding universal stress UspA family protein
MSAVLAVVERDVGDLAVHEVAEQIARLLGAGVTPVELTPPGCEHLLARLGEPLSAMAVMRVRPEPDADCWQVMSASAKPVVLVPPGAAARSDRIGRVLLPLDGSAESSAAMTQIVDLLSRAPIDIVALHVFGAEVPRYWDQTAHAHESWSSSFLAEHVAAAGAELEIRMGSPGDHILAVADDEEADLIALGWSQRLNGDRAKTVRQTVLEASVPVLLAPVMVPAPSDAADAPRE